MALKRAAKKVARFAPKTLVPDTNDGEPQQFPLTRYAITDGVTQSLLGTWQTCRVKAWLYLNGVRSAKSDAFQFGTIYHGLIERFYKGNADPESVISGYCGTLDLDQKTQEMAALAATLFRGYVAKWRKDDAKKQWVEVEGVFDESWRGFRLRGKVDGLYRDPKDKGLWILETKTKSQIDQKTLSLDLTFNFQNLFYIVALQEKLGERINGVLYSITKKPSLRQGVRENVLEYRARVAEDIEARPETYYVRFPLVYAPDRIELFKRQLLDKLNAFHCWLQGKAATWRNESCCNGWGYSCNYLRACSAECIPVDFERKTELFEELSEDE